ncbi:pirin family protein [Haloactinopolyspora alba]|nr:pirin family protein [Haloactinopolyspora alba]
MVSTPGRRDAAVFRPDVVVIRADERFVTAADGIVSRHSFSFGSHYDPGNVGFGLLIMSNDDVVEAGAGYATHPHRDVEIVTWVLEGELAHQDSSGDAGAVRSGQVQRMSAGRGIRHSEFNAATGRAGALRFVQMWLPPDAAGADPAYAQRDVVADLIGGDLVPVVSGLRRYPDAAVGVGQSAAAMHVARPGAGASVTLPNAPFVHVYVTRGAVDVDDAGDAPVRLGEGDAVRLTDEGGRGVRAVSDAEIVLWEMHALAGVG